MNIAGGMNFVAGEILTLFSGTSRTGAFTGIVDNQQVTFDGYEFTADYPGTAFNLVAVPEPGTGQLMCWPWRRSLPHIVAGCGSLFSLAFRAPASRFCLALLARNFESNEACGAGTNSLGRDR